MITALIVMTMISTVALLGGTQGEALADTCPPGTVVIRGNCYIYKTVYYCDGPHYAIVGRTCYTTFWGQTATYPASSTTQRIAVAKVPCPPKAPKSDSGSGPSYPIFASYGWPPGYNFGFR